MNELLWAPIEELSGCLDRREVSAVELLEMTLRRIRETEPFVSAYATVLETGAHAAAAEADRELSRGQRRSRVQGVPIAVKDVFFTAGAPTGAGSRVLDGLTPDCDADVVRRLQDAGAVVIGKTVAHEFGYGQNTPPTRNAWNTGCYPGGTSAGSAVAVAVGSAFGALGTDTGGSIRIPAALNGVVGLKPTLGRISRGGMVPMSPSLDTIGPLARTARDCAIIFDAVSEPRSDSSAGFGTHESLQGFTVGLERSFFFSEAHQVVSDRVEDALSELSRLGAKIVEVEIDHLEYAQDVVLTIVLAESSEWHHALLRSNRRELYDPSTRILVELGEFLPATAYVRARRVQRVIQASVRGAFEKNELDALLAPTLPRATVAIEAMSEGLSSGAESVLSTFFRQSAVANAIGLPALSVPCGFTDDRLPVGFQLIGAPFRESTLLAIAERYQTATDWHEQHPDLDGMEHEPGALAR